MSNAKPSTEEDQKKQVEVIKNNSNKALASAQALVVSTPEEMNTAAELLTNINKAADMLIKMKESVTKPLNEALKNARAMFKIPEDGLDQALVIVKQKMVAYQTKVEDERRKKEAALAARVEKGTMKIETAARKIEDMPAIQRQVAAADGAAKVIFRDEKKVVITDENLIPREYLVPDMVKIRKVALAGVAIPGITIEIVKNLANQR